MSALFFLKFVFIFIYQNSNQINFTKKRKSIDKINKIDKIIFF